MEKIEEIVAMEWKLLANRDADFIKKLYIDGFKYASWKARSMSLRIDVEDVISEVILRVSEENHYNRIDHHISVIDHIKRRINRLLLNYRNSHGNRVTVPQAELGFLNNIEDVDAALSEEAYKEGESADERQSRVDQFKVALQSLSPLEIQIVELLYVEDLDEAKVADILKISVKEVKLKKREAFLKLKKIS